MPQGGDQEEEERGVAPHTGPQGGDQEEVEHGVAPKTGHQGGSQEEVEHHGRVNRPELG